MLFSLNNRGHRLLSLFGSIAFESMKPEDMSRLLRAAIPPDMDGEEIEDYEESEDYEEEDGSETDEGCKEYEESEESGESEDLENAENNEGHTQFRFLMTP